MWSSRFWTGGGGKLAKNAFKDKREYIPYAVYFLLSLAVLGRLLFPGYVLALDMVFTPHNISRVNFWDSFYGLSGFSMYVYAWQPLSGAAWFISHVMPMWVIQKILIFLSGSH